MNNGLRWILIAANLCLWSAASAVGQGLPTAKPEKVGLSSERLERLEQVPTWDEWDPDRERYDFDVEPYL